MQFFHTVKLYLKSIPIHSNTDHKPMIPQLCVPSVKFLGISTGGKKTRQILKLYRFTELHSSSLFDYCDNFSLLSVYKLINSSCYSATFPRPVYNYCLTTVRFMYSFFKAYKVFSRSSKFSIEYQE